MKIKRKIHNCLVKEFTKSTGYYTHQGALRFIENMDCDAPFLLDVEFCFFLLLRKKLAA